MEIRQYVLRFQRPESGDGDIEVEVFAESGDAAVRIARTLPELEAQRAWRVTAADVTPQAPWCNSVNVYRDAGETPADPYYSAAAPGSACQR
jgi:hypothetical protein